MLRKGVSFLLFFAAAELFAVIQLVMPSNPSSAEQQALLELQPILEKALQKKVTVVSAPGKEKAVFLGDTALCRNWGRPPPPRVFPWQPPCRRPRPPRGRGR